MLPATATVSPTTCERWFPDVIKLQNVSYVRLGTADLDGATTFATDYLGLEISHRSKDSVYLKSDQREHTLCYFHGSPTDQIAAFEVSERGELEMAASKLDRLGHQVRFGSAKEAELRRVRSFIAFQDPTGNNIELVWRPAYSSQRYHGERDAGITGFSHIGLCTTDAARDEIFWTKVCNARVSDRIGDAALLRIDQVHHTIALFPTDRAGIQHINHQVATSDHVMRSFNFLSARQVPMVFGPGRHPTSSARFLYFEGPDRMVFEYSSGVREIADEMLYRERQLPSDAKGFCEWGAKPQIKEFRN
jgi:2,3-dihydroxy-p-cumate/2,3-dihydroxybenzoate 3,4-dioxygenase